MPAGELPSTTRARLVDAILTTPGRVAIRGDTATADTWTGAATGEPLHVWAGRVDATRLAAALADADATRIHVEAGEDRTEEWVCAHQFDHTWHTARINVAVGALGGITRPHLPDPWITTADGLLTGPAIIAEDYLADLCTGHTPTDDVCRRAADAATETPPAQLSHLCRQAVGNTHADTLADTIRSANPPDPATVAAAARRWRTGTLRAFTADITSTRRRRTWTVAGTHTNVWTVQLAELAAALGWHTRINTPTRRPHLPRLPSPAPQLHLHTTANSADAPNAGSYINADTPPTPDAVWVAFAAAAAL